MIEYRLIITPYSWSIDYIEDNKPILGVYSNGEIQYKTFNLIVNKILTIDQLKAIRASNDSVSAYRI